MSAADSERSRAAGGSVLDLQSVRRVERERQDVMPSEDAVALAFVTAHDDYRYVAPWNSWIRWDGKRWADDSTGRVYELIRVLVRTFVEGGKAERTTANASFVAGVERLLRTDQRLAVLPEQLDADPWVLNTQDGIVDLRSGALRTHDRGALCTKITHAGVDARQGAALWATFLHGISQGNESLTAYLQRVAGYCATGVTSEDVLIYLFGIGANGKSSFAEAIVDAMGDYAKQFGPEVLMEAKGERHPNELAQFLGVRLATTSEPSANATWNDSRVKSLTGDAEVSARFMRGEFFTFKRTHKTMVVGNHMPKLGTVTHAIRRRVQMVPFRAVFTADPCLNMRERLRSEALGAIMAWIIEGARLWAATGTAPPAPVLALTEDYISEQDEFGQWLEEACERDPAASELSSHLHRSYTAWADANGARAMTNKALSGCLRSAGFEGRHSMGGKLFYGLRLRPA